MYDRPATLASAHSYSAAPLGLMRLRRLGLLVLLS